MRAHTLTLLAISAFAAAQNEVKISVPNSNAVVALSTRGATALRVRLLPNGDGDPIHTPMVAPDSADAPFERVDRKEGTGIHAKGLGSLLVSTHGELTLLDASSRLLTKSKPLGSGGANDTCASQPGMDITSGTRAASPMTVADEAACCAYCQKSAGCKYWIFGHPGNQEGNCWPMSTIGGTRASPTRTLGGAGAGSAIRFSSAPGALFYGRGAGKNDAHTLTATSATALVDNTRVYTPHYHSPADGYAVLAVVNQTSGDGKTNKLPVTYTLNAGYVSWTFPDDGSALELYLMPAQTLDEGAAAYLRLIGPPAVPPRFAFGFIASRWGWGNRSYIEYALRAFREGNYPIDAFIVDFGWFTNVSDYNFAPQGVASYHDFGYSAETFPDPKEQLTNYRKDLHVRMGGIRKPRLGNTELLIEARSKGYLLPGGEASIPNSATRASAVRKPAPTMRHEKGLPLEYAEQRNLNYSDPAVRQWYAQHQRHYLDDGVAFFWNDEGETDYFTFHEWNVAQQSTLAAVDPARRFYSINRAWSPGMARLGATVWTGDIDPSWNDLRSTPGMVLNWGLGGAPYVACDIGGFTGESNGPLLTRWMQLGTFMPTMRVHSTHSATAHFPFLWPEPYRSRMRDALNLRYRLLPFHYSLAHRMHTEARLWMRPLAAEFPSDATARPLTSQWLDGELLVAPVLSEDSISHTYLPAGTWYAFNSTTSVQGPKWVNRTATLHDVPVYVRPGSLIPLAPIVQHTGALPGGALEVQAYAGADGTFTLVEDDGETTAYLQPSGGKRTAMKWDDQASTLSWTVENAMSGGPSAFTELRVALFTSGEAGPRYSATITLDGKPGSVVVPKA